MKTLILLAYYNRPKMVLNALTSIVESSYQNWHLAFIDDFSKVPGEPIARSILDESKITFYQTGTTAEEKLKLGGGRHGAIMNQAIRESDADLCVILCDDDALYPSYLANINDFFEKNSNVSSCYSRVIVFDPLTEDYHKATNLDYFCNNRQGPINGCCQVDASQVAWRTKCNKQDGVWFDELRPRDHDLDFFNKLYALSGPMVRSPYIAQYKGWHAKQLGNLGAENAWTCGDLDK